LSQQTPTAVSIVFTALVYSIVRIALEQIHVAYSKILEQKKLLKLLIPSIDFQAANPCSAGRSQVFYPHPNDNTKFIQCNALGEMYIIQCPAGKLYNTATVSCVSKVSLVYMCIRNLINKEKS
jgi:hypothetical protein